MLMFPRVLSKPKANSVSWCPFLLSTPSFFSVFTQLPVRKLLRVLNFWFPSCPENWNFANTVSSILLIGLELPPTRATERECYCPRGTGYLSGWRRQLNINFETLYTHKKKEWLRVSKRRRGRGERGEAVTHSLTVCCVWLPKPSADVHIRAKLPWLHQKYSTEKLHSPDTQNSILRRGSEAPF